MTKLNPMVLAAIAFVVLLLATSLWNSYQEAAEDRARSERLDEKLEEMSWF